MEIHASAFFFFSFFFFVVVVFWSFIVLFGIVLCFARIEYIYIYCIIFWQNTIAVTNAICERSLKVIISSENQDFLWPRGVKISWLLKTYFQRKTIITFFLHSQWELTECLEKLFQKFSSDVIHFAAFIKKITLTHPLLEALPAQLFSYKFYQTEYGPIICAKRYCI